MPYTVVAAPAVLVDFPYETDPPTRRRNLRGFGLDGRACRVFLKGNSAQVRGCVPRGTRATYAFAE